ncbi:transmembrane protein 150A-like isoform X1 [Pelodiscus sinensis]|uniref:transmembrane protein 150A-like isoform X1 n=1 Tax=Pelodiscus sinensis TaxID=13735 RepID=UPI003F6CED09
MPAWGLLPATLPAVTIAGMWIVYAMALANNHICPVHNWSYNQSCGLDGPAACCTLDHIPLVSKCGTFPPESCFFSLICSLGSFLVMLVGLLRYAHVIERCGPSLLNTLGLAAGWLCAAGLTMVGNFQVDHAKVLHYIGAGVAFPTSTLFVFLQSVLTYRMARTRGHYWTGHVRSLLTALAFLTLVFRELRAAAPGGPVRVDLHHQRPRLLRHLRLRVRGHLHGHLPGPPESQPGRQEPPGGEQRARRPQPRREPAHGLGTGNPDAARGSGLERVQEPRCLHLGGGGLSLHPTSDQRSL